MKIPTPITWQILLRNITGQPLTEEETCRLRDWLDESAEHRAYYERARRHWLRPDEEKAQSVDVEKFIRRFDRFAAQTTRKPRRYTYLYKYAAILLIPLCLYLGATFFSEPQQPDTQEPAVPSAIVPGSNYAQVILGDGSRVTLTQQADSARRLAEGMDIDTQAGLLSYKPHAGKEEQNTLVVPRGGQYTLRLADGTRIWVNAGSQLTYPTQFDGAERTVTLSGEAYFEVAKDADRPFIVRTHGPSILVYGTSFNVEAYPDETLERTTLASGSVGITVRGQETRLAPGQQAVMSETGRVEVRAVDASIACSWHTGVLSVERESLENILTRLGRWYDVDFTFRDDALRRLHFTGDLERYADFNDILRLIRMTTSVDFVVSGRQVEVISRNHPSANKSEY